MPLIVSNSYVYQITKVRRSYLDWGLPMKLSGQVHSARWLSGRQLAPSPHASWSHTAVQRNCSHFWCAEQSLSRSHSYRQPCSGFPTKLGLQLQIGRSSCPTLDGRERTNGVNSAVKIFSILRRPQMTSAHRGAGKGGKLNFDQNKGGCEDLELTRRRGGPKSQRDVTYG